MASEVTSDLKFELSGLNNLCSSIFLAFYGSYVYLFDKVPEAKYHPLTRFALMALVRKNVNAC